MGTIQKNASFKIKAYSFNKVSIDTRNLSTDATLSLHFYPQGLFHSNKRDFDLSLIFAAKEQDNTIVEITCDAKIEFEHTVEFNEIPDYFFSNSIAILFPYIRAFISSVTLLSNITPIVLPILNLSSLGEELKENTTIKA